MIIKQSKYETQDFKRKALPQERRHLKIPLSNIVIIAKIKGQITEEMLRSAILKVEIKHPIIKVKSVLEPDGHLYFSSKNVPDIPIQIIPKISEEQWKEVIKKEHQIPFDYEKGPLLRIILLQAVQHSDLVIFCQHSISDGMSLAYLARDIVSFMAKPNQEIKRLVPRAYPSPDYVPSDVSAGIAMKIFGKKINKMWKSQKVEFDKKDYMELHKAFWNIHTYKILVSRLNETQTLDLIKKCRKEDITVNTAITTAFLAAQIEMHDSLPSYLEKLAVAVDERDRLINPVGEVVGFNASGLMVKHKYDTNKNFWENARSLHKIIQKQLKSRKDLQGILQTAMMDELMLEARPFAGFGYMVPQESPSFEKINKFLSNSKNVVIKNIKKIAKKYEKIVFGSIITNLGRTDFPKEYANLILDELLFVAAASPQCELVLGIITHAGKLDIVINYFEEIVNTELIEQIAKKAIEKLKIL
ncbi:MAG: condensation domain-containing protein [Promethearchaeota archaeon]